ncbi:MAG: helix-turn-helix domain-containing protein, partial [Acidobacteriales bacterium]|nr:helix-turn-helix domain-containing protein [Terriglobales bacterium]
MARANKTENRSQLQNPEFAGLQFPPDRRILYVREIALKLRVTEQHVSDLIEEGKLQAVNVAGSGRKSWRIPVESYEAFLRQRDSLNLGPTATQPRSGIEKWLKQAAMRCNGQNCKESDPHETGKMTPLFTASQIGSALGRTRQAIQNALAAVKPDGQLAINGQLVNGWPVCSMPPSICDELAKVARAKGYRSIEDLLIQPKPRWQPPASLGEIDQRYLNKAAQLMRALRPSLV